MSNLTFEEVLDLFPSCGANLAGLWQRAPRAKPDAPAWSCVVKVGGFPPTGSGAGGGNTPGEALHAALTNAMADAARIVDTLPVVIPVPEGVTSAVLDE